MSIITQPLAEHVEIDGVRYQIHTDFRNWIQIGSIMSDRTGKTHLKLAKALALCYFKTLPASLESAAMAMLGFYAGTQKLGAAHKSERPQKKAVYDFEYDAEYIFAAFMAQYGIDLTACNLHWHKFKALLTSLNDDNKLCKIIEYRSVDLGKIKDKEQKAFYRRMKQLYRLPDMRTEAEKEEDMLRELAEDF